MKSVKVKGFKVIYINLRTVAHFYKDMFCLNRQAFTVKIFQVTTSTVMFWIFFFVEEIDAF